MKVRAKVGGRIVVGRISVLYPRILAVELISPRGKLLDPLQEYGRRLSPVDAALGRSYCEGGRLTRLGLAEAERVLRRLYRQAARAS